MIFAKKYMIYLDHKKELAMTGWGARTGCNAMTLKKKMVFFMRLGWPMSRIFIIYPISKNQFVL